VFVFCVVAENTLRKEHKPSEFNSALSLLMVPVLDATSPSLKSPATDTSDHALASIRLHPEALRLPVVAHLPPCLLPNSYWVS
jgi:hypothetical protein